MKKFTEAQLREGSRRCIDNVKGLLHSASLLLDNKNSQQYALGLYIYAVEEYGKAILLKKYITRNKDKYQIPAGYLERESSLSNVYVMIVF
jgi:AbiV family abortive infection protein